MSKHINRISEEIYDITGLPHGILSNHPIFQLFGNNELIIEGAKSIEYYDKECVKILTSKKTVTITGNGLLIKCLANKNLSICGCIKCLEFEEK